MTAARSHLARFAKTSSLSPRPRCSRYRAFNQPQISQTVPRDSRPADVTLPDVVYAIARTRQHHLPMSGAIDTGAEGQRFIGLSKLFASPRRGNVRGHAVAQCINEREQSRLNRSQSGERGRSRTARTLLYVRTYRNA